MRRAALVTPYAACGNGRRRSSCPLCGAPWCRRCSPTMARRIHPLTPIAYEKAGAPRMSPGSVSCLVPNPSGRASSPTPFRSARSGGCSASCSSHAWQASRFTFRCPWSTAAVLLVRARNGPARYISAAVPRGALGCGRRMAAASAREVHHRVGPQTAGPHRPHDRDAGGRGAPRHGERRPGCRHGCRGARLEPEQPNLIALRAGALAIRQAHSAPVTTCALAYAHVIGADLGTGLAPSGSLSIPLWPYVGERRGMRPSCPCHSRMGLLLTPSVLFITLPALPGSFILFR